MEESFVERWFPELHYVVVFFVASIGFGVSTPAAAPLGDVLFLWGAVWTLAVVLTAAAFILNWLGDRKVGIHRARFGWRAFIATLVIYLGIALITCALHFACKFVMSVA